MPTHPRRRTEPSDPADGQAVPAHVVAAVLAAFDVFDREGTTAALVSDVEVPGATGHVRRVAFAGGAIQVTVSVPLQSGAAAGLDVTAVPDRRGPAPEIVDVRLREHLPLEIVRVTASCWSVRPVPTGPVSVAVRHGSTRVNTEWTVFAPPG